MDDIRRAVREEYAKIAGRRSEQSGCCGPTTCGGGLSADEISSAVGYSEVDLADQPEGANLGLGSGNPVALAGLRPGESVLDLGSGAGLDCLLAARAVGETGRVIGVDMTPEMVTLARENAARAGVGNIEFRLGEIEHLPVVDRSVDVVISNCVINLSPDKRSVFSETHRVLKPGGRLVVSDVVATGELPEAVRQYLSLHAACVAGAATVPELEAYLAAAGFDDIEIQFTSSIGDSSCGPGEQDAGGLIASAMITATRRP